MILSYVISSGTGVFEVGSFPDTTVTYRESNTDLPFERLMPYLMHHTHSLVREYSIDMHTSFSVEYK